MTGDLAIDGLRAQFSDEARSVAEEAAGLRQGIAGAEAAGVINGQLLCGGTPLAFFYIQVAGGYYQTDANGWVSIPASGSSIAAKVWAANDAVRVINGEKWNIPYTKDVTITAGASTHVPEENNAFALAALFRRALEDFRVHLPTWKDLGFDLNQARRIEVSWPDKSPAPLSFTEGRSLLSGYPLIHLKGPISRLLQESEIWHEYAHAVHFAYVSEAVRVEMELRYLGYILTHLSDAGHHFKKPTADNVAWIEAWGAFCGGFERLPPSTPSPPVHGRFRLEPYAAGGDGRIIEGAIAYLLFQELPAAASWSIDEVARSYVFSQAHTLMDWARYMFRSHPAEYARLIPLALKWNISLPNVFASSENESESTGGTKTSSNTGAAKWGLAGAATPEEAPTISKGQRLEHTFERPGSTYYKVLLKNGEYLKGKWFAQSVEPAARIEYSLRESWGGEVDDVSISVSAKLGGFDWSDGSFNLGFLKSVSADGEYFFCLTADKAMTWRMKELEVAQR